MAVRFSSTEANCPVTPSSRRTAWGSAWTSWPKISARPSSMRSRVASMREHRRLARAVGAEDAEHLAVVDLEVDPVDGAVVAVLLDEPGGTDRESWLCGHGRNCPRPRFHHGSTPPAPLKPVDGWIDACRIQCASTRGSGRARTRTRSTTPSPAGWPTRGSTSTRTRTRRVIELLGGNNVVLATPTGSGKSLVATGAHFAALATRQGELLHRPDQGAGQREVLRAHARSSAPPTSGC